jgi:DNA polymerase-3 subunit delta'
MTHPDMADRARDLAKRVRPEGLLRSIDAVLACRAALDRNVKPRFAVAAMAATLIAQTS